MAREMTRDASSAASVTMLLQYRPPYDWPAMLSFLRARAIPGIERVSGESYARTIEIDGVQGTLRVQPGDPTRAQERRALRAVIRIPHPPALPAIVARLRRVFDLTADPRAIGEHLSKDPSLAPLVAARPGLRVPGAWEGFELAMRAVLGQQITVTAAVGLAGKLVAAYGAPMSIAASDDPALTHVFPRPERLADANLSTLGMPKARAAALSAIAAAVVRDAHLFRPKRTLDEAIVQLRALDGIGEWTAHYIAMRAMREPDAFPAADIGLLRAMADTTGRRPNPRDLLARAEQWRPWRAYAAQHLWSAAAATAAVTTARRTRVELPQAEFGPRAHR
jgi:AraC family transcriptional regulator of adaptative response / DNA-3-methyladenine glycosylase II